MHARAVKTTDEVSGMKKRLLVASNAQFAGFLAAVRTAHGLTEDTPCFLSYMDEDGDRIQIETDNDLAAAITQVQAGETFRVFVRSGENIGSQTQAQAFTSCCQNGMQVNSQTKQQQRERNLEKRKEKQRENLERKAEKLKEKQKQQTLKQEQQANPYQYSNLGINIGRIVTESVPHVLNEIFRDPLPFVNNLSQYQQIPNSITYIPPINQFPYPQCYVHPFIPPPQYIQFSYPFGGQFIPQSQQPDSTAAQQTSTNTTQTKEDAPTQEQENQSNSNDDGKKTDKI